jgi:hypothetical protein
MMGGLGGLKSPTRLYDLLKSYEPSSLATTKLESVRRLLAT